MYKYKSIGVVFQDFRVILCINIQFFAYLYNNGFKLGYFLVDFGELDGFRKEIGGLFGGVCINIQW